MAEQLTTLGLKLPTDPRWADIAGISIEDILIDHAYCEQKAASSCISLIITYPEREKLVTMLTPVVAEEWAHFERVLEQLQQRGYRLGFPRKDAYVAELYQVVRKGGSREQVLAEKLLMNALIEARSAERFKLLHLAMKERDPELSTFYYELMVSEAGHYRNFIELAKTYHDSAKVETRWQELLRQEAQIISRLEARSDRMH